MGDLGQENNNLFHSCIFPFKSCSFIFTDRRIAPSNHRISFWREMCTAVYHCSISSLLYVFNLLNHFADVYHPLELYNCLIWMHQASPKHHCTYCTHFFDIVFRWSNEWQDQITPVVIQPNVHVSCTDAWQANTNTQLMYLPVSVWS